MRADAGQLAERWNRACESFAAPIERRRATFEQLLAAYTAPDRHYHGIDHVEDCLRELDGVRQLARNLPALELAIWFHDVVYDGRRNDNEEQSAEIADADLSRLGAPQALRDEVRRLILLTRHDREPAAGDVDGQLIVDVDLASLARSPEVFDENTRLIRLEYPHVAERDFRRGRRDLLSRFLARPRIYYTDALARRYEAPARENLERALSRMDQSDSPD